MDVEIREEKKIRGPISHLQPLCFHSGQTGKVRWKVRLLGDKLENWALSLGDFLVQREVLMALLVVLFVSMQWII